MVFQLDWEITRGWVTGMKTIPRPIQLTHIPLEEDGPLHTSITIINDGGNGYLTVLEKDNFNMMPQLLRREIIAAFARHSLILRV